MQNKNNLRGEAQFQLEAARTGVVVLQMMEKRGKRECSLLGKDDYIRDHFGVTGNHFGFGNICVKDKQVFR